MENTDHFRKLENMYLSAPFNEFYSPVLRVTKGQASVEFAVKPAFFHSAGATHGAVYFKALDDAAFFAVNSLVSDFFVLTVTFTTYFIRPVSEGLLRAEGRLVNRTSKQFIAESVLNAGDKEIARGSGSFLRSRIKLTDAEGYK